MAWISVHEQVKGHKLRRLSKAMGCSQNEALGTLVSLWLWSVNNADKDGVLIGCDKDDISETISIGMSTGLSAESATDCLIECQWIDFDGVNYIIHDWDLWQEQWYNVLNRRKYDAERKREIRKVEKIQEKNKCPQDNPQDSPLDNPLLPSPSPSPSPIPSKPKGFIIPTFDEIDDYCKERNNNVDASRWIDFYTSNGWMVGKNKMKDWKAAVRTWERNSCNQNNSGKVVDF